ncbi:uncharacterized protein LOC129012336 [Pongo pygmaeus]|uniref:uncharacterized protein LOC129012336 n=1 Tax=Pongo pygmaeus TaxID=9600 RepID=UPI00300CBAC8
MPKERRHQGSPPGLAAHQQCDLESDLTGATFLGWERSFLTAAETITQSCTFTGGAENCSARTGLGGVHGLRCLRCAQDRSRRRPVVDFLPASHLSVQSQIALFPAHAGVAADIRPLGVAAPPGAPALQLSPRPTRRRLPAGLLPRPNRRGAMWSQPRKAASTPEDQPLEGKPRTSPGGCSREPPLFCETHTLPFQAAFARCHGRFLC